jgi:hypothetical protein
MVSMKRSIEARFMSAPDDGRLKKSGDRKFRRRSLNSR